MDEKTPGSGIDPLDTAIDMLENHRKASFIHSGTKGPGFEPQIARQLF
jgi:hypothetical protein